MFLFFSYKCTKKYFDNSISLIGLLYKMFLLFSYKCTKKYFDGQKKQAVLTIESDDSNYI